MARLARPAGRAACCEIAHEAHRLRRHREDGAARLPAGARPGTTTSPPSRARRGSGTAAIPACGWFRVT